MKHVLPFLLAILLSGYTVAQTEISSFNATGSGYSTASLTDYQCLGINPANLGWKHNDHKMNLGFLEFAGSVYSEPLTKKELLHNLLGNPITLSDAEKADAAKKFVDTQLFGSASLMWIGFSYQDEKIGGFAFNIRERLLWNSKLNKDAANFLYLGYNDPYFDSLVVENNDTVGYSTDPRYASNIYNGTDQQFLLYREFNFGYGRKVVEKDNFTFYMGIGIKYIMGYGMTQYYQDDNGNNLVGYSALSPAFGVDYDTPTPSQLEGNGYQKVGSGFGFDIGTTFELLQKKLMISLSVVDIGSINWDGNVYEGNNGRVWKINTKGIDNYNIFEQGELIDSDNLAGDPDEWTGLQDKKIELATTMRGGMKYKIDEKFECGLDVLVPFKTEMPGSYLAPVYGVGGKYRPAEWVDISLGVVTGGKCGTNLPFGVTFYPVNKESTMWTLGVATRDLITMFSNNNPTVSAAFGFLRFSFGE